MHEARVATGRLNTALPLVTSIYNTRCMVYMTGRSNQCCHSALASNRGFSRTQVHEKLGWCSRRGGAWIKMPRFGDVHEEKQRAAKLAHSGPHYSVAALSAWALDAEEGLRRLFERSYRDP